MSSRSTAPSGQAEQYRQAAKVVVQYDNGDVEEFNPNRPRTLLDMEKRWGVQQPETHEQVIWLAHHVLQPDKDWDEWIDTVAELHTIDLTEDKDKKAGEG